MARRIHKLIIKLDEPFSYAALPKGEYACQHIFKRVASFRKAPSIKVMADGSLVRGVRFTIGKAGRYDGVMLCDKCVGKDVHAYEKLGPGPLKPPPLPIGMRAKAGQ